MSESSSSSNAPDAKKPSKPQKPASSSGAAFGGRREVMLYEPPPTTIWGILRRLGPGLIVAGSIVGSGELIATTKTGAEAGFTLLWLIIIGCVIKVFTQVEFGRFSIINGQTTMTGLNKVPGPALRISGGAPGAKGARGNWIMWYWFVMFLASIGQLGGIVGGVGQALMISIPITARGEEFRDYMDIKLELASLYQDRKQADVTGEVTLAENREKLNAEIADLEAQLKQSNEKLFEQYGKTRFAQLGGDPDAPNLQQRIEQWGREEFRRLGGNPDNPDMIPFVRRLGVDRFKNLGGNPKSPDAKRFITELGRRQFLALVDDQQIEEWGREEFRRLGGNPKNPNMAAFVEQIGAEKFAELGGNPRSPNADAFLTWLGWRRFLIEQWGREEFKQLGGDPVQPEMASFVEQVGANRFAELGGDPQAPSAENFITELGRRRFLALGGDNQILSDRNAEAFIRQLGKKHFEALGEKPERPVDDRYWAAIIAVGTAVVLVLGRYNLIQIFSTAMVASFTLITVVNLIALQSKGTWAVSWSDIGDGLSFRLPPPSTDGATSAIATALATFGIIGVGASELVTYPYWCLEKGYARFTGPRDWSTEWAERARGWMRVMRWDAWCSMVVYTFATIAFYLLGAAVLGRTGLNPEKSEMVHTLSVMYKPVFGAFTNGLFLFGAFAVLYSTYFVANASHARTFSDALRVLGFAPTSERAYRSRVRVLSGVFPMLCFIVYVFFPNPAMLVLLSGLMQAIMLPMLALAALYFRYMQCDRRLQPSMIWDIFLWISALGMFIAGVWAALSHLM